MSSKTGQEKPFKKEPGWKDIPDGGKVLKPGSAFEYKTGTWRTFMPVLDKEKCNNCLTCWIYCPDAAVILTEGKMTGFDLDHCKGCGICAQVCPAKPKAIAMARETEFQNKG